MCFVCYRCSHCRLMWPEGWCIHPLVPPVTPARSALLAQWRALPCTGSTWTNPGRLGEDPTRPCRCLLRVSAMWLKSVFWSMLSVSSWPHKCEFLVDLAGFIVLGKTISMQIVSFHADPNMVNAYMYQTAGSGGQPAAPGQAPPPNTSPPYTNYQPTPTQGYQVSAVLGYRCLGTDYSYVTCWKYLKKKHYCFTFNQISCIAFVLISRRFFFLSSKSLL